MAIRLVLALVVVSFWASLTLTSGLVVGASAITGPSAAEHPDESIQTHELRMRGAELRSAIEKRYTELSTSHALKPRNAIDDLVSRYIPIGTTFDDAKIILVGAGLAHHIVNLTPRNPCLSGFGNLSSAWFAKVDVSIYISPSITGDFHSPVGNVSGLIGYATL